MNTKRYNREEVPTYQKFCERLVGDIFPNYQDLDADIEPMRRIWVTPEQGGEVIVRLWNIWEDEEKNILVDFSLFD